MVLTGACFLSGWSKTSQPLEAPEDNDGWSSAEELINSSDAEEEGRVGPRKLVTLGPLGPSVRHGWPLGGRAPERDHGGAVALVAVGGGAGSRCGCVPTRLHHQSPARRALPQRGRSTPPQGRGVLSAVSAKLCARLSLTLENSTIRVRVCLLNRPIL